MQTYLGEDIRSRRQEAQYGYVQASEVPNYSTVSSCRPQSVSTSDFHPYAATAAADGTCMTVNLLKPLRRGGVVVSVTDFPEAAES
jgi:hypothetical protein